MPKIALKTKTRFARRRSHPAPQVHFHRGPQGQPMPCYDEHCMSPRLSV